MRIKIININIWIGGILWDELCDFLRKENPDIILMQEVFNGDKSFKKKQYRALSELQNSLDFPHAAFAPSFTEKTDELDALGKEKEVVQGNAVLSKFPLTEVATTFYDVPFGDRDPDDVTKYHVTPRNLQQVTAEVAGTQLHLFNTQGIWGEHGGDTPRRLEMAQSICEHVDDLQPVVLAGDLNVHEKTQTIDLIRENLVSVFYDDMVTSFNLPRKDLVTGPGYATSVVDMLFVSRDVKVVSKKAPQVDISDHLPLVVEIELQ